MVQPQQQQKSQTIELVPVSQLEDWAQLVFEGIEKSIDYKAGYLTVHTTQITICWFVLQLVNEKEENEF